MTYRIALPEGGRRASLDLVEPNSSAVQRFLRRHGLAGYEPSTVAALLASFDRSEPGFGFIDVGANMGLYSLLCAAIFEPGSVLAVEPTPSLADLAESVARANDLEIEVRRVAASSSTGTVELHLALASDVSNSLEAGFKSSERSIMVDALPLDRLVAPGDVCPSVVKVDVEGHEAAVLAGARPLIERCRPTLVVEVLNRRGGRLADAISSSLDGFGYHCYELAPEPTWEGFTRVEAREEHRDWLLLPEPVDEAFIELWTIWLQRVALCTADRSSRVPFVRTAVAAFRRGGLTEVVASADRFLRRSSR